MMAPASPVASPQPTRRSRAGSSFLYSPEASPKHFSAPGPGAEGPAAPPPPLSFFQPAEHVWLLAVVVSVFVYDVYLLGIDGEVNSRELGFIDAFAHCASWISSANDHVLLRVFFSVLTKYFSGTLLSYILNVTPTIMLGPWNSSNMSFAISLVLAHLLPSISRLARSRTGIWRAYFVVSASLFKTRKFKFAISTAATLGGPAFVFSIGILSVELTAWLAWGAKRVLRHEPFFASPWVMLETLLSPRTLLTLAAIYAEYNALPSILLIILLVIHKATKPSSENVVY